MPADSRRVLQIRATPFLFVRTPDLRPGSWRCSGVKMLREGCDAPVVHAQIDTSAISILVLVCAQNAPFGLLARGCETAALPLSHAGIGKHDDYS